VELSTLLTDPAMQLVVGLLFLLAIAGGIVTGLIADEVAS